MNSYEEFHLKEVINASGKITILGVSKVSEAVLAAQWLGGEHFFEMSELSVQIGAFLANLLKVEDTQVVSSASVGIVQSVAALIGKGSLYHTYHLYIEKTEQREIALSKGHNADYGTPVEAMVVQGSGQVVEVSYANMYSPEHVEMMVSEKAAAILYIKSHHTVQKNMLAVTETTRVVQRHKVPLTVDAAAEEDLFKYTGVGADLVIYSGTKAIEGPSVGLVIGKKEYTDWVRLQGKGVSRVMKVGKDNILGLTQTMEEYLTYGSESGASVQECLKPFAEAINNLSDLTAKAVQGDANQDIYCASIKVNGRKTTKEVTRALKVENPAIYTREYQTNSGITELNIRSVNREEMNKIVQRL